MDPSNSTILINPSAIDWISDSLGSFVGSLLYSLYFLAGFSVEVGFVAELKVTGCRYFYYYVLLVH